MSYRYPPTASRIKSLIHAGKFIKDPFPILDKAVNKLGTTYTFYMGGMQRAILTIDPDTIKHILQKHHRKYEKSAIVTDILAKYTGRGLLTSTGDYWLQHRRLIQPGFHRKKIESLQTLIQAEIDTCMDKWKIFASTRSVFDAYEEMNQLTFRIIAKALFSTSIEEHGLAELSKLIGTIQSYVIKEVRQPYKRWWFKLSGTMAHHQKLSQIARDVLREIVRERKQSAQQPDDLLTMLLEARFEGSGLPMEDEQLIDECLILFVAGHETSANALSWMIFLLGKDQEVYKKIQSAEGEDKSTQIRNVIFETLRLYPPAWVVDRISLENDEIGEFTLPKDTVWIIYLRGMHRHPGYWKQPDEFIPDRWSDPDLNKEAFMPFGAGPRLCIGEHFAMMEMQMIITSIADQWHLDLKVEIVEQRPLVTLRPGSPVLVSLRERS